MKENNFCPICGKNLILRLEKVICECGNEIKSSSINSQIGLGNFDKDEFLPESYSREVNYLLEEGLKAYELDKLYFRSSSAKKALNQKIDFINGTLTGSLIEWKELLEYCENNIIEHKSMISLRIYNIINLIIKEFYGPFKVDPTIKEYKSYIDFSIYNIKGVNENDEFQLEMKQHLALSNVVGRSLESGFDTFFSSSVFKDAEKSKRELTKDDLSIASLEAGISILGGIVSGVSSAISQNSDVIGYVREVDKKLNNQIEKIYTATQSLSIHENEILKKKKVLLIEDEVLDFCNSYSLAPVLKKCFNEPLYIEYKEDRYEYDVGVYKSDIEEEILMEELTISFWKALMSSKLKNFKKAWIERKVKYKNLSNYYLYNEILGVKEPELLQEIFTFKKENIQMFKEHEKKYRKVMATLPSFIDANDNVSKFVLVIKRIKNSLDT